MQAVWALFLVPEVVKAFRLSIAQSLYIADMKPRQRRRRPPLKPGSGGICHKCSVEKQREVQLIAGSSRALITYYYCRTKGCNESRKIPRPARTLPSK